MCEVFGGMGDGASGAEAMRSVWERVMDEEASVGAWGREAERIDCKFERPAEEV
jgi:hypothetical protein